MLLHAASQLHLWEEKTGNGHSLSAEVYKENFKYGKNAALKKKKKAQ